MGFLVSKVNENADIRIPLLIEGLDYNPSNRQLNRTLDVLIINSSYKKEPILVTLLNEDESQIKTDSYSCRVIDLLSKEDYGKELLKDISLIYSKQGSELSIDKNKKFCYKENKLDWDELGYYGSLIDGRLIGINKIKAISDKENLPFSVFKVDSNCGCNGMNNGIYMFRIGFSASSSENIYEISSFLGNTAFLYFVRHWGEKKSIDFIETDIKPKIIIPDRYDIVILNKERLESGGPMPGGLEILSLSDRAKEKHVFASLRPKFPNNEFGGIISARYLDSTPGKKYNSLKI